MEAAFGRLHKGGPAAFGGRSTFVDTIMDQSGYWFGTLSTSMVR